MRHALLLLAVISQARAFKFWLWYAGKQKRQRVVLARTQAKRQKQLAVAAFSCWQEYVQHRHLKVQLGETQGLQVRQSTTQCAGS